MFLRTNDRKILWLNVGGGSVTEIAESELALNILWQTRQSVNSGLQRAIGGFCRTWLEAE